MKSEKSVRSRPMTETATTDGGAFGSPRAKFERWRDGAYPDLPLQSEIVRTLCDLYEAKGLLPDGKDLPLQHVCPCREQCWGGREHAHPNHPDRAGISVPWVGAHYFDRRICVVGTNASDWGGIDSNWRICPSHKDALLAGRRGKDGSPFAEGAMRYAHAVERSLGGATDPDTRAASRPQLAETWESCAYLQAVKCSPSTPRSEPFPEMFRNCPSLLLKDELEILRPDAVIVLGRTHLRDWVRPMLQVTWGEHPGHLERDSFELGGSRVELFSCNHPSSAHGVGDCLSQLVSSLREKPVPVAA